MNCCKNCYLLCYPIPDCLITLVIVNPNLTEGETVILKIKDKFGNVYKQSLIVEAGKKITADLTTSQWRSQLLNPYAGDFDISIEQSNGEIVNFTKSGNDYECIRTSVQSLTPKVSSHIIDLSYDSETSESV